MRLSRTQILLRKKYGYSLSCQILPLCFWAESYIIVWNHEKQSAGTGVSGTFRAKAARIPGRKEEDPMIQFQSEQGTVSVSSAVFSNITGMAATNCFGVKGMAFRSMTDGLVHLLRREAMSKGVSITYQEDNSITIELHIVVENGVNIPAVCRSIMNEVRYVVTKNTGVEVRAVDVCVDSMTL